MLLALIFVFSVVAFVVVAVLVLVFGIKAGWKARARRKSGSGAIVPSGRPWP